MREQKDGDYFIFTVGKYLPSYFDDPKTFKPYQPETEKLVGNVFTEENGQIIPINLFEYNWCFLKALLEIKKKYSDNFEKFADAVNIALSHEYGSRSEYETIITSWPPYVGAKEIERLNKVKDEMCETHGYFYRTTTDLETRYKLDIYTQVMLNWDRFIDYLWNNKNLITAKKLGIKTGKN